MKRQLSDKQLDNLMRSLLNDAAADEAMVNEIADSPSTWWGVQRQINTQKETARSPWPPIKKFWRLALIGMPAAAAVVIAISFFAMSSKVVNNDQVNLSEQPVIDTTVQRSVTDLPKTNTLSGPVGVVTTTVQPAPTESKLIRPIKAALVHKNVTSTLDVSLNSTAKKTTEIKTDFIALSYARNPDSGQIVRIKVPSSMMVTLGLVATVERTSSLVDAEVLVGDDGLTRAIRFIH